MTENQGDVFPKVNPSSLPVKPNLEESPEQESDIAPVDTDTSGNEKKRGWSFPHPIDSGIIEELKELRRKKQQDTASRQEVEGQPVDRHGTGNK